MQYVRGKLTKLDDFLVLLDVAKTKGGEIKLSLPMREAEFSICYDGDLFYLSTEGSDSDPKYELVKFLEEWIRSEVQPTFEFYEDKECGGGLALTEDQLKKILTDRYLEKAREMPDSFEITKIDITTVPSFLVAHWKTKKPVSKSELYKHNLTLSYIAKLIDNGKLEIRAFTTVESMPVKLRSFLMIVAAISLIYLILPLNFIKLSALKINEAVNWALREKVVGTERRMLPVKGCFNTPFILDGTKIVNPGIDGKPGTGDDLVVQLPTDGYIPTFTVPAK